jgi:hypothetical protein
MRHVVCVGEQGRRNASVLAQKAQVGKRVPLSCTSHRTSAAQVVGGISVGSMRVKQLKAEQAALTGLGVALVLLLLIALTAGYRCARTTTFGYIYYICTDALLVVSSLVYLPMGKLISFRLPALNDSPPLPFTLLYHIDQL